MTNRSTQFDNGRRTGVYTTAPASPPLHRRFFDASKEYERVYAIGDIHGEFDLFRDILEKIRQDNKIHGEGQTVIVLLGDLIDRGPDSRQVLEIVQRFHTSGSGLIVLRGDHEEMLLASSRGNPEAQKAWMRNGGRQTLESYDICIDRFVRLSPDERADEIFAAIGADTLQWLESRPLTYRSGGYLFCHAGIRPGVKLGKQTRRDLVSIGEDFLSSKSNHGHMIVHGHSEVDRADIMHNRINLDTGAYRTGMLTAIGLQGTQKWLLSAKQKKRARSTKLNIEL